METKGEQSYPVTEQQRIWFFYHYSYVFKNERKFQGLLSMQSIVAACVANQIVKLPATVCIAQQVDSACQDHLNVLLFSYQSSMHALASGKDTVMIITVRFSTECSKTKTTVITLNSQSQNKGHTQYNEPIKTSRSNHM